ncbi:MAG: hypothetical protein K2Y20_01705 [Sphingomonas sp.]|nr:hypothetical protein [Sphingomonas sp.]
MIRFENTEQRFYDDETNEWMRVDRAHPSQEFYHANYGAGGLRLRLDLTAERLSQAGDVRVLVTRAHRFVTDCNAWLAFRRSNDVLNGACRLLTAWAARYFSVPSTAVSIAEADSGSDPDFNEAAGPPTADALEALVSAFQAPRNGK